MGHLAIGLPWPVAFVLGVIVSPTDPVAVSATAECLGLPNNIVVTILEGESLINNGSALALYRTAVAAVVAGSFSILEAGSDLVLSGIGGAVIGLAVGWVISHVRTWVEDPFVETTIALFTGYAAYPTRGYALSSQNRRLVRSHPSSPRCQRQLLGGA